MKPRELWSRQPAILAGALKRHYRLGLICYAFSALGALPAAAVAGAIADGAYSHSLLAPVFVRGLDPQLLLELAWRYESALPALIGFLLATLVVWILGSVYLGACTLSCVARDGTEATPFLASGATSYLPLLRLFPLCAVFLGLFVILPAGFSFRWIDGLCMDLSSPVQVIALKGGWLAFFAILFALAEGLHDRMRVQMVIAGERRAHRAFARGLVQGLKHPLETLALMVPFLVVALFLTLLSSLIDVRLPRTGLFWVVVGFFLQQATCFARALLRVGLFSLESRIFLAR